jgi:hypothetical protein
MNFVRQTILTAMLALASATAAYASDVSMANGDVRFTTPDTWLGIMETQGDPEVRVFQVPDPSPSASSTLARVSVTVKQVSNIDDFNNYMSAASAKAQSLKGYQPSSAQASSANSFVYTASENGQPFAYVERYWFRDGHAIQLRCVRPAQSQAGGTWTAAFDRGCDAVAASLGT